jgi:hypothetical protein
VVDVVGSGKLPVKITGWVEVVWVLPQLWVAMYGPTEYSICEMISDYEDLTYHQLSTATDPLGIK